LVTQLHPDSFKQPALGVNDVTSDFNGTGEINAQNTIGEQWDFFGNPSDFKTTKALINTNNGAGGIPYFKGTSNSACLAKSQAMGPLAVASLTNLGCYAAGSSVMVPPAYGSYGTTGPGIFRGMPFYNMDMSVTKTWAVRERYKAQFRAEFFNILNHPNISNVRGGPGGAPLPIRPPTILLASATKPLTSLAPTRCSAQADRAPFSWVLS
jgi:hypothetical protein